MADLPDRFIGGTAAAALAGVNPPRWSQPIDVYLELTEPPRGPRAPTRMMAMGRVMEQVVADLFTSATGIKLRRPAGRPGRSCPICDPDPCTAVRSRQYPWAGGHLDRWADDGAVFEAKWGEQRGEWGPGLPVGTTEAPTVIPAPGDPSYQPVVPLRYAVQVQHYLAVTGRPLGYLAVLLGYGDFRWFAIHANRDMQTSLMQIEERFWRDNVLAGVPPDPDGSERYGQYLRRRWSPSEANEAVATPEQAAMVEQLRAAKVAKAEAERRYDQAAQVVQRSMHTTTKLVGPGWSITWPQYADRQVVQWEALATALLHDIREEMGADWPPTKKAQAAMVRAEAAFRSLVKTEPGSRPFTPTFDDMED